MFHALSGFLKCLYILGAYICFIIVLQQLLYGMKYMPLILHSTFRLHCTTYLTMQEQYSIHFFHLFYCITISLLYCIIRHLT